MFMASTTVISVWSEAGIPVRLLVDGVRYTVTDRPTPIRADLDLHAAITHPAAAPITGWRFQGTDVAGRSRMFDVRRVPGRREWELLAVYD